MELSVTNDDSGFGTGIPKVQVTGSLLYLGLPSLEPSTHLLVLYFN